MKPPVQKIVDHSSVLAAGLAVVLSPIPLADEALTLPLLGAMTVRIGHAHGLRWKEIPWKPVARTAVSGLAARATVTLGVAFIPVVAAVTNAASAATLTGAFGAYADRVCADPARAHTETLEELKVDMHDLAARWRRLWRQSRESSPDEGEPAMNTNTMNGAALEPTVPRGREVRASIEHALHTRHFGQGEVLFAVEDRAKTAGTKVWDVMKKRPYAGVAAVSALGFAVASTVGVGELAVAVLFGYGAFEVLRRGRPVGECVEEVVRDMGHMG